MIWLLLYKHHWFQSTYYYNWLTQLIILKIFGLIIRKFAVLLKPLTFVLKSVQLIFTTL